MKKTNYAYAVGRIRVNELSLLSSDDVKRLIGAKTYDEAAAQLNSKGYEINGDDYASALKKQKDDAWQLIKEVVTDLSQMNSLIIKNDYHNLKAAVKSAVSGEDARGALITPSVYDTEKIYAAVNEKKWSDIPEEMRAPAQEAYDVLVKTRSAQLSDAICDKYAMKSMLEHAKKAESSIFNDIAQLTVALADIKIAYRCINAGKSADFMKSAMCGCSLIDIDSLVSKASNGSEDFFSYLEKTSFKQAAQLLRESPVSFEKYGDDMIMEIIERGKRTAFGIDPIVSYYEAKEAELITVRIVLSGKLNGASDDVISERVRKLYV